MGSTAAAVQVQSQGSIVYKATAATSPLDTIIVLLHVRLELPLGSRMASAMEEAHTGV